jgi:hypothetical protein
MAESTNAAICLDIPLYAADAKKIDQVDLDTVSTEATTSSNTFGGSSGSEGEVDVPSSDEQVQSAEEKENKPVESTEAKGSKKTKGERRNRRGPRSSTNAMLYTKAMYKRRFCAHYPDVSQCKRGLNAPSPTRGKSSVDRCFLPMKSTRANTPTTST